MKPRYAIAAVLSLILLAGCEEQKTAASKDRKTSEQILTGYQKAQPVPVFNWSQLRQNLIEIETAQADTTQTTSFFFTMTGAPVNECPSIGFPIPATYQLTAPEQLAGRERESTAIPQIEANGVFTADTTGTYVICVSDGGDAYPVYWEGFVQTVAGAARWDDATQQINLVGKPSVNFSEGK